MHQRFLMSIAMSFFTAGVLPVALAHAQSASSAAVRRAEEHAAAAREQAQLAQENAERAAQEAVVAEEQAARMGRGSTSARRAELERELAERKAQDPYRVLILTLGEVHFSQNQAELTPGAMRRLDVLVLL